MTSINNHWVTVGSVEDLVPGSGVGAAVGEQQIALFWLPDQPQAVRAISNYCPFSGFHLLARGIVGDIQGELVVASPLYKQHFSLVDGRCIEKPEVSVPVYCARIEDGQVQILH